MAAPESRVLADSDELLTTHEFYRQLAQVSFHEAGPRIRTYGVDLDPEAMLGMVVVGNELAPIASSDGLISHVRENPHAHIGDNSGSSRYFSLHTDGQYLPTVPEIALLYCVDPGTSEIPTVFVDTKDILDTLHTDNLLPEAGEYLHVFRNKYGHEFVRPLVEINPASGERVMNVALASPQCQLQPITGSARTQREADVFYKLLQDIAERDITPHEHAWKANNGVVFDNRRLIHGRGRIDQKALDISDPERHLVRMWLERKAKISPGTNESGLAP